MIVALSSTEAEYIAAATAIKKLLWLQVLLQELGYSLIFPGIIYCDNQSCITLSANPKYHNWSKHIDLRFHFLREKVQAKILKLQYTSASTMWVDILTKSLTKDKHQTCIQALTKPLLSM
jgi:hypothetical protein